MGLKPGHKQTEVGAIPDGWRVERLGDLLKYERPDPYIVKSSDYDGGAQTPVLTANKSFILGYTNENVGICRDIPAVIFDDFTTDSKYVDFPFKVKSSAIKILRCRSGATSLAFIHGKMLLSAFPVGEHKRHYISEYQELQLVVPGDQEQCAIAGALGAVDALLGALTRLIAKKRDLKQAAMQQLLTGQTRLPGFSGEWEVKCIKDIAPLQRGFDLPTSKIRNGPYPVVYSNGVLTHHSNFMVKGPGVVTGRSGTIG
ncbi:MAG TPA: hypothetical protein VFF86_00645, partial [Candidatus Methylomirabilis sp.]|nr:hypothetical protein [Candidatus Methylomirabilis sp.]